MGYRGCLAGIRASSKIFVLIRRPRAVCAAAAKPRKRGYAGAYVVRDGADVLGEHNTAKGAWRVASDRLWHEERQNGNARVC